MAFNTQHVATASCEWKSQDGTWFCAAHAAIRREGGIESLDAFCDVAKEHFANAGWQFLGDTKCPRCVRRDALQKRGVKITRENRNDLDELEKSSAT